MISGRRYMIRLNEASRLSSNLSLIWRLQQLRQLSPNSITPTLRLSPDTNHESPRHKSRRRLSWFVFATIRDFVTSRHVEMVCVSDFHGLCSRLSPRGSFGENRRNGIWALYRQGSECKTTRCRVSGWPAVLNNYLPLYTSRLWSSLSRLAKDNANIS